MSLRSPTLASREGLPIPIPHEDAAPEPYTLLGLFGLKSLHPHCILIIAPTVAPSENPCFCSFHLEGSPPSLPKVLVKGGPTTCWKTCWLGLRSTSAPAQLCDNGPFCHRWTFSGIEFGAALPPVCVQIPAYPGWPSLFSYLGHSQAASP